MLISVINLLTAKKQRTGGAFYKIIVMDTASKTENDPTASLWKKIVELCKDLKAVIAIVLILFGVLPLVWHFVEVHFKPEVHLGKTIQLSLAPNIYAETDGFVTVFAETQITGGTFRLIGEIISTNGITDQVAGNSGNNDAGINYGSIAFPVPKGNHWQVTFIHNKNATCSVYWTPLIVQ